MKSSKVLACNSLSDHKKKKSWVIIFCIINATGSEKIILKIQNTSHYEKY